MSERWKGQLGANSGRGTSLKFLCILCMQKLEIGVTRFGVEATFAIHLLQSGMNMHVVHTDTARERDGQFLCAKALSCLLHSNGGCTFSYGGPRA